MYNTDTFNNPCINQNVSPPIVNRKTQKMEKAHVSFIREFSPEKIEHNPAAILPVTKSIIIDSPHTLALAGLEDCNIDKTIDTTEAVYRNEVK